MTTIHRLRRQIQTLYGYRQPMRRQYVALIGHPDGRIDDTEHPGSVFVRIEGQDDRVRHALCRTLVPRYNLAVKVAYSDEWPDLLEVMNEETARFPPDTTDPESPSTWPGPSTVGKHAPQHDIGGGDTDWIQSSRLLPLSAHQNDPANMRVVIKSGWYPYLTGANYFPGALSQDMTSFLPVSSGVTNWRIVFIEGSTNLLGYTQTGDVPNDVVAIEQVLDLLGSGRVPLCAIALILGMSQIVQSKIIDLRFLVGTTFGTVTGGGGVLWGNVAIVATSGGEYTSIQAAVAAEPSGTCILIAPGAYAENVSLPASKSLFLTSLDGARQAIIAPSAGVPLTLSPAGDFHTVTGLRLNPASGARALVIGSGATGTVRVQGTFLGSTGTGSVDASLADAALDLAFRDCFMQGTITTKALTALTDCEVGNILEQVAGAGNLSVSGGQVDGDLFTVTGSTTILRNLPSIGGLVYGSGAIQGAYLNSAGHTVMSTANLHKSTLIESRTSLYEFSRFV